MHISTRKRGSRVFLLKGESPKQPWIIAEIHFKYMTLHVKRPIEIKGCMWNL